MNANSMTAAKLDVYGADGNASECREISRKVIEIGCKRGCLLASRRIVTNPSPPRHSPRVMAERARMFTHYR